MSTYDPVKKWENGTSRDLEDCIVKHDPKVFESDYMNAIDEAYDDCVFDKTTEFYDETKWTYEKFRKEFHEEIARDINKCYNCRVDGNHTNIIDGNEDMDPMKHVRWHGIRIEYLELLRGVGLDPLFVEIVPSGKEDVADIARLYCMNTDNQTISVFVEHNYSRNNPDVFQEAIENHIIGYMLNKIQYHFIKIDEDDE